MFNRIINFYIYKAFKSICLRWWSHYWHTRLWAPLKGMLVLPPVDHQYVYSNPMRPLEVQALLYQWRKSAANLWSAIWFPFKKNRISIGHNKFIYIFLQDNNFIFFLYFINLSLKARTKQLSRKRGDKSRKLWWL